MHRFGSGGFKNILPTYVICACEWKEYDDMLFPLEGE